jgi:hypothetical protein
VPAEDRSVPLDLARKWQDVLWRVGSPRSQQEGVGVAGPVRQARCTARVSSAATPRDFRLLRDKLADRINGYASQDPIYRPAGDSASRAFHCSRTHPKDPAAMEGGEFRDPETVCLSVWAR